LQCVKEGERILVIDHKGAMMNHSNLNPTIENLEEFLLANPSYQPVLASEQIGNKFKIMLILKTPIPFKMTFLSSKIFPCRSGTS